MLRYRFHRHWVFFYLEEPASPSEILRKSSTVFVGESHRGYLFNPTWWYSSTAKTALIYLIIKLLVFTKPCWHAWVFLWLGTLSERSTVLSSDFIGSNLPIDPFLGCLLYEDYSWDWNRGRDTKEIQMVVLDYIVTEMLRASWLVKSLSFIEPAKPIENWKLFY